MDWQQKIALTADSFDMDALVGMYLSDGGKLPQISYCHTDISELDEGINPNPFLKDN